MTTRAKGPLSGLDWLRRGLACGRRNPRAILGGAAVLMAAAVLPNLLQLIAHGLLQPGEQAATAIAALVTLLSVALMAPLIGGYLRLIDASEHGRPVHARDVFAPFRSRHEARPLILFALVLLIVQLLGGALLGALFRETLQDLQAWSERLVQLMQQATPGGPPPQLPAPPDGLGGFLGLGSLLALFVGGVFAVGAGQIALRGRSVGRALAEGFDGAARNLLPLLVLALAAFALTVAVSLGLVLVLGVLSLVAAAIHPALAAAVLLPLYLALLAVLYAVVFGIAYQLWRDVTGEVAGEASAGPVGIEV